MLYLHNDIFLTDIIGYDQLKCQFILPQNDILRTPLVLNCAVHSEPNAPQSSSCLVSDIAVFVLKRDVKLQLTN